MLSSPIKRDEHDEELRKQHWTKNLSLPKMSRYIASMVDNIKSRALLLQRRLMIEKEFHVEVDEIRGKMERLVSGIKKKFLHFSKLPTIVDRVSLLGEMVFSKNTLIGLAMLFMYFL